jgi:hypothetical protein
LDFFIGNSLDHQTQNGWWHIGSYWSGLTSGTQASPKPERLEDTFSMGILEKGAYFQNSLYWRKNGHAMALNAGDFTLFHY